MLHYTLRSRMARRPMRAAHVLAIAGLLALPACDAAPTEPSVAATAAARGEAARGAAADPTRGFSAASVGVGEALWPAALAASAECQGSPDFCVPDGVFVLELTVTGFPCNWTATIDWGDGSSETVSYVSATSRSHTYAPGGPYTLVLTGSGTPASSQTTSCTFTPYTATIEVPTELPPIPGGISGTVCVTGDDPEDPFGVGVTSCAPFVQIREFEDPSIGEIDLKLLFSRATVQLCRLADLIGDRRAAVLTPVCTVLNEVLGSATDSHFRLDGEGEICAGVKAGVYAERPEKCGA